MRAKKPASAFLLPAASSSVSTMDPPASDHRPAQARRSATPGGLRALGVAVLLLFILIGAVRVIDRTGDGAPIGAAAIVEFGIFLAGGLAGGGLLVGAAAILADLRELHTSLVRMEQSRYEQRHYGASAEGAGGDETTGTAPGDRRGADPAGGPASMDGSWQEVIRLLQDIRDNSLLSEAQRQEKLQHVAEEEIREAQGLLRSLTAEGDFVRAREIAEKTQRKYPDDERSAALAGQVEEARRRQESDDVIAAGKQVNDLISISAWQRAREVAQQVQGHHPDSAEARQLLLRIEREHKIVQDEQRRRMYAEVQRYVTRRRWEEALAAARTFIERFPGCDETEALRLQIPTLKTNAEIGTRQKLEAEIMDLAKHGRYMEAVELAKKVIAKFPDSPQADALRSQLGRLEELAGNPDAPRARVRLDD